MVLIYKFNFSRARMISRAVAPVRAVRARSHDLARERVSRESEGYIPKPCLGVFRNPSE